MKMPYPECTTCKSRSSSLFSLCSCAEAAKISISKTCNIYKKEQVVFHENVFPIGLFCINTGAIKLSKIFSTGKEQILRIARAGDFIGYRSLITNDPYSVTATALEDSTICLIPKSEFHDIMRTNKNFYTSLLESICKELENTETKLGEIAYKPVRGRMAEALLLLSNTYKEEEFINLTREDLASFVGTVKETAIRVVSEFKEEKLISIDKRRIKIINAGGLLQISNLYD